MSSFGSVGHVLTNHGGAWSNTWICTSVSGSGITGTYVYSHTSNPVYDIKFDNGQWLDGDLGTNVPTHFGTNATDWSPITPTDTHEDLYLYFNNTNTGLLAHLKNDGYTSSGPSGTLSGGSSPEIKDITITKLSDTSVSYSFNWQNVNNAFLFVNSTQHTIALGGSGQSGTETGTLTGLNDLDVITISNTDFKHTHRFVEWSKLVWGSTKSVVAETFGEPGYEYRISNTLGDNTSYTAYQSGNQFAMSAIQTTSGKVTWQVWKHVASPLHMSKHGSSFTTGTNTRQRNFW